MLEATHITGELQNDWPNGHNEWLSINAFRAKEKLLASAADVILAAQQGQTFVHEDAYYAASEY